MNRVYQSLTQVLSILKSPRLEKTAAKWETMLQLLEYHNPLILRLKLLVVILYCLIGTSRQRQVAHLY